MVGALLLTTTVSRFSDGRFRAECGFCISTMMKMLQPMIITRLLGIHGEMEWVGIRWDDDDDEMVISRMAESCLAELLPALRHKSPRLLALNSTRPGASSAAAVAFGSLIK